MSARKLALVQKVLRDAGMRAWYADMHEVHAEAFTVQNVREYGLGGMGDVADEIIADGEGAKLLTPAEVADAS